MANTVENFDMIAVSSSNLKAIGYSEGVIRIEFIRGSKYDYSPCTKEEFVQGVNSGSVSGWFNTIKATKNAKKVESDG